MPRYFKTSITALTLLGASLLYGYGVTASAATYVDSGSAAGAQCSTSSVNDSAQAVGNCSSATVSANSNPWYAASLSGPQQVLPPLVNGQPCSVEAIANSGWMLGSCANAANLSFADSGMQRRPRGLPTATAPCLAPCCFPCCDPPMSRPCPPP